MSEEEQKQELAELERATDLAAIEYFEALQEQEALNNQLTMLRFNIETKRHKFEETKIAHLRAKHGIPAPAKPEPK